MSKPNLFKFATGELSQDAFIAWSLAWGRQEENSRMREFGLSFLNRMLEKHNLQVQDLEEITIIDVKTQVASIDVLVSFIIQGKEYELIIEDKVNTGEHSNQIEKYFNKRRNESPEKTILGIYYKTGFIFENEKKKIDKYKKNGYPVEEMNKRDIMQGIEPYVEVVDMDILKDYYSFVKSKYEQEEAVRNNVHSSDIKRIDESLKGHLGQVEAMKTIFGDVKLNKGKGHGKPWVHYSFVKGGEYVNLPDRLYYRIDRRKHGHVISIKQYNKLKNVDDNGPYEEELFIKKKKRLEKLRYIFENTIAEVEKEYPEAYITPGKKGNRGKYEIDIGVFYFSDENTVERFKRFFEAFHDRFHARLAEEFDR